MDRLPAIQRALSAKVRCERPVRSFASAIAALPVQSLSSESTEESTGRSREQRAPEAGAGRSRRVPATGLRQSPAPKEAGRTTSSGTVNGPRAGVL